MRGFIVAVLAIALGLLRGGADAGEELMPMHVPDRGGRAVVVLPRSDYVGWRNTCVRTITRSRRHNPPKQFCDPITLIRGRKTRQYYCAARPDQHSPHRDTAPADPVCPYTKFPERTAHSFRRLDIPFDRHTLHKPGKLLAHWCRPHQNIDL